jgi:regulator of replication initiation timing
VNQQTTSRIPVLSARSSVLFHNSVIMAMKRSTRKFIEENRKLKQEVEKLKESVAILLQDVTCARIQLSETQARLDAMVYCLGSESAEHRLTKDMLNHCIQDRAQDRSQI